ncbi:hypothetical protein E4T44_06316 [Aureobasidium sp. EXF-8845]|nr:hypothetical protein E4T44_06316 [Aureobasidium sp. EXF-8845]KAI4854831.1 hypothetical protein E4T45_03740 [Aureobasidium sp. EXF-8846]
MASKENIPANDPVDKENSTVSDTDHADETSAGREGSFLARLMAPLTIRIGNIFSPVLPRAQTAPDAIHDSEEDLPSSTHNSKHAEDKPDQNEQPDQEDEEKSDENTRLYQSDQEQSEVESIAAGSDEDDYEFSYEDDDDVSLDDDPFFGSPASTKAREKPGQPTEEQLEAIRKALEIDENEVAIRKALERGPEPPVQRDDDMPDLIAPPHPLLKAQNDYATEMLVRVRSSFGGDVHHVVGLDEPLIGMKLNFLDVVKLPAGDLDSLEFLYGYHVIKDNDTAKKLKISPESIIHCQKIGDLRYDIPPEPAAGLDDVETDASGSTCSEVDGELN